MENTAQNIAYIKEIYSDSTINKIEIEDSKVFVYLTSNFGDKLLLTFLDAADLTLHKNWNQPSSIEALEVRQDASQGSDNKVYIFIRSATPKESEVVSIVAKDLSITKVS